MRQRFDGQLAALNRELISMGALCEEAIAVTARSVLDADRALAGRISALEEEIDQKEREIERVCLRLLLFAPAEFITGTSTGNFLLQMFQTGVVANFALAWINLLPIPPLDGGHILETLLPGQIALQFQRVERYGFIILVLLLASGALSSLLMTLVRWSWNLALTAVGL